MKKICAMICLLITQNVLAQQVTLGALSFVKNTPEINNGFVPCKKNICSLTLNNTQEYLVSIVADNGMSIHDKKIEQINIEVKILSENQLLEIKYNEKIKTGYINDKNEFILAFANKRISEESTYEKIFYVQITHEKSYKVKINEQDSIEVFLK